VAAAIIAISIFCIFSMLLIRKNLMLSGQHFWRLFKGMYNVGWNSWL